MATSTHTALACDRCTATLAPTPGTANDARARARLDHGWRRVRGEHGLPVDLCDSCSETWLQAAVSAHAAQLLRRWERR